MRYTTIMLSLGLAAVAIVVLRCRTDFRSIDFGDLALSRVYLSWRLGNWKWGTRAVHAGEKGTRLGHRGFRSGFWIGGYPAYRSWGSYPLEYNTSPSTTCVWSGYEYTCYNFPSERMYLY